MPHRAGLADVLDARAESLIGRMSLSGLITPKQYESGRRYETVVRAYRVTIEAPRAAAGGIDKIGGRAAISDDEAAKRRCAYDDAFCALYRSGRGALMAVNRAVFAELPDIDPVSLRIGLDALAGHFGL